MYLLFHFLFSQGLISRLTSLLPSLTEETKVRDEKIFHNLTQFGYIFTQMRVEKLIGQLYQYISSGGYLMKEPSHLAKYDNEDDNHVYDGD